MLPVEAAFSGEELAKVRDRKWVGVRALIQTWCVPVWARTAAAASFASDLRLRASSCLMRSGVSLEALADREPPLLGHVDSSVSGDRAVSWGVAIR